MNMRQVTLMDIASGSAGEEGRMSGSDAVWHRLGSISALFAEGDCHGTEILGRKIGLFRVAGIVYAIDDICTHGNARLSEGELDGFEVECPLHAGLVDIRTGKALCSPLTRDTQAHHVRLVDGQVDVRLEYGV